MQSRLNEVYERLRTMPELVELPADTSAPLCLQISQSWDNAARRILVVGQETCGWGFKAGELVEWPAQTISTFREFQSASCGVPAMVQNYVRFAFGADYRSTPFWRAHRLLRKANGDALDGMNSTVLWTNLFRCDLGSGSPLRYGTKAEQAAFIRLSSEVLLDEIRVLEPHAVIFFTGPRYDRVLQSIFVDARLEPSGHRSPRVMAKVSAAALPEFSWRTYHPAYLQRSGQNAILQELCASLP